MVVRGGGYHTPPEKSRRRPQAAAAFRSAQAGPVRPARPWFRVLPDDDHEGVDLAELDLHDVVARRGVVGV